MKIEYYNKKWEKEVLKFNKFKKEVKGDFNKNENHSIQEFIKGECKDYLRLYDCLSSHYANRARYSYLENFEGNNYEPIKYTYLSAIALLYVKTMYEQGIRTTYNGIIYDSLIGFDYTIYQLIAVNETDYPIFNDESNIIMLLFKQKLEKAENLVEKLPDKMDESREVYYIGQPFLKNIYRAIINKDEKQFNEVLVKRIKKYRKIWLAIPPLLILYLLL